MKNFFFLFFLIFLNFSAFAQEFKGGISLGISGSQIDGDKNAGYSKAGLSAGIFVKRNFKENWDGQLELRFMQKGSKITTKNNTYSSEQKVNLSYLEVPVFANYIFNKSFDFQIGLAFANLIKSSIELDGYELDEQETETLNTFDTSLLLGLNYKVFEKLYLNIRLNYSFTPVKSNTPYWFNNSLSMNLSYNFK